MSNTLKYLIVIVAGIFSLFFFWERNKENLIYDKAPLKISITLQEELKTYVGSYIQFTDACISNNAVYVESNHQKYEIVLLEICNDTLIQENREKIFLKIYSSEFGSVEDGWEELKKKENGLFIGKLEKCGYHDSSIERMFERQGLKYDWRNSYELIHINSIFSEVDIISMLGLAFPFVLLGLMSKNQPNLKRRNNKK